MKNLKIIGLVTLLLLVVFGLRIYFIWRERNAPVAQKPQRVERQLTADDVVLPRKLYIDDLKSAKALIGKTVWVQSGFTLDYYPYVAHHVEFAHPAGVLPSVEPLQIEDILTEKAPANLATRVPLGDKQVFAIFKKRDDNKEFATAIGSIQGDDSKYYCDDIFYYDDPHQMYKHWAADVWQSIDQHQAKAGMSELQAAMSLGMIQQSDSSDIGNRTVHYDAGGKKWAVAFEKDKATNVTAE
ncbi:hypothetical protein HNQ77_003869 [Silvibacterium bohemicum]|uniref:Uncharacterized protein n=1 Tax=Silvibacterium bohemicum TaxID=1577686 RepID=A0A841K1S4_9BACT|nr:hypothetical protein [Silvibacterium bohemicum]MBB6145899.1 hypothetical protein [Silvibacterium bohemicum]